MANGYTAKDITVLEGLEPVRKRPAMAIGGVGKDGYHHLLAEILDNSIDEAMNGHGNTITVSLSDDRRTIAIADDGRGVPVDPHPKTKVPAVTVILTTLHAGGKFEKKNYAHSGGLHGVGASVVNALAEHLEVTVRRDGREWTQEFSRGHALGKLKKGKAAKGTGTAIRFTPDAEIFGKRLRFDPERIVRDLDDRSFVHKGVRFVFRDEATGKEQTFRQRDGIVALLGRAMERQGVSPTVPETFTLERVVAEGEVARVEVVLTWITAPTEERIRSYVNGVHTPAGGTHVAGLRGAVLKAVKAYLGTHSKLVPKGVKIGNDDIREGLMAIVSIFMAEPQFQGQTKSRLNNPEANAAVDAVVRAELEDWLNTHSDSADGIMVRIVAAARARAASRAAAQAVRKKGKHRRANLPDKLADCSSNEADECELFIVEGDSAGGSAKQGRDRKTQAVLPLRGKVLNAEQASLKKVLGTRELADIVQALGCGLGDTFDLEKLNYDKIILLMDADADGDHITTLLLTFFYRYLGQLIEAGRLYVARPPLFKVESGKDVHWAVDEAERDTLLAKLRKKGRSPSVSRFKGLGEMMPKELAVTTLDRKTRTLYRVAPGNPVEADRTLRELMGKDTAARFEFIMDEAVNLDDLDV